MAGQADMTAQEFRQRYGRRPRGTGRIPRDGLPRPVLMRLEVDGVAVTMQEFLAAHARYCDCLTERGGRECSAKR